MNMDRKLSSHIENITAFETLPDGDVLVIGEELDKSDLNVFFEELGKTLITRSHLDVVDGSDTGKFAVVIVTSDFSCQSEEELLKLLREMHGFLVDEGILVAFFNSEKAAEGQECPFYSNRSISQMVSHVFPDEQIATLMSGERRVIAKKR